jgi:hypothetical protein
MDVYKNGKGEFARIAISHDIAFIQVVKIAKASKYENAYQASSACYSRAEAR